MKTSTINAIAIVVDFFTEEEREGLAINLNGHKITFLEQLTSRWYRSEPRYFGAIFKTKAAMLISSNKNLFFRLIEMSKPEFQAELNKNLLNLANLFKTKKTVLKGDSKGKALNFQQGNSKNVNRSSNKSRGGSADSGQEFVEIDKVWDQEDSDFLSKGLQTQKIFGSIELAPNRKTLEETTLKIEKVGEAEEKLSFEVAENTGVDLEEHEVTLHTITTNQTRTKSIHESAHTKLNYSESEGHKDTTTTANEYSLADAYNKLFSFKLKDLRELVFQKLDVLFIESCQ